MTNLAKGIAYGFLEKYTSMAIGILTIAILARILTPAETGLYSIATGLINIAQSIREFGTYSYILQDKNFSRDKLASVLGVNLLLGGILFLLFNIFAGAIARFYGDSDIVFLIRLLSLNFILVSFASVGASQLQRNMRFRAGMVLGILSMAGGAVISIACVLAGLGAQSLAWGSLAGLTVTVLGNAVALGSDEVFVRPSLRYWRELMHYGLFSCAGGLLNGVAERTPDLVIGRAIGFAAAGYYSRGNSLVTLFRSALTNAIDPVIASNFALLHRSDLDTRAPLLTIFDYLSMVGWPVLAVMAILSRQIIIVAFGDRWVESSVIAAILCIATGFALIGNVCQTYMTATGGVRTNFLIQAICVPLLLIGVILGARHSLEFAALGAAVTGAIMTLISLHLMRRRVRLSWLAIGKALLKSSLTTLAAALTAMLVLERTAPVCGIALVQIIVTGFCAMLMWLACVFLLRHPIRTDLVRSLRRVTVLLVDKDKI